MENKFVIHVNGNEYQITPLQMESVNEKKGFKVETKCEYLFTIVENDNYWSILDKHVEPLDDLLIQQIGFEIETNGAIEK
jgi:hypothetical protein